jgi:hypothetical protein
MSTSGLLLQCVSTIKIIKRAGLVHLVVIIIISLNVAWSRHGIAEKWFIWH